ncbi:5'/3'-nucleotidase SurE [Tranquillimonas alkanivorans]|uniref:5'-nucleotidase SurE n=1 Tax=Tranquillimonas alkanivorans TaxID=441119 RepID=A0A1I5NEH2_9RHOB|nr:5'/3'-nucleotidase SurE [Tranquillimonas alkanivorans]SFP20173.1 5'-nucleotidase /3'-nucleotidase /exopolyphosphatase [Tranquillimonas alkanivorans]
MRILITNDDGINAPGLKVLERIAHDIAGDGGEVWTVAPAFEQSGVAHATSHAHPTMIVELAERRYAAEGSPSDCVLAGVHDILPDKPDLILSGVNRGNNSAENAVYSGTLGAAIEGALQGLPSIALSQYIGPENIHLDDRFEAAAQHGADVVRKLLEHGAWDEADYRLFYNVNFPPVRGADVRGLRVTSQGFRQAGAHGVEPYIAPNGRRFIWIKGSSQQTDTGEGTDAQANIDGYISITPMRADFTAHEVIEDLRTRLE